MRFGSAGGVDVVHRESGGGARRVVGSRRGAGHGRIDGEARRATRGSRIALLGVDVAGVGNAVVVLGKSRLSRGKGDGLHAARLLGRVEIRVTSGLPHEKASTRDLLPSSSSEKSCWARGHDSQEDRTDGPCIERIAAGSGFTLNSLDALWPLLALWPLRAFGSFRPLCSVSASRSLSSIRTISAISPSRTGFTLWPLRSSLTLRSLWAFRSLWANATFAVDHPPRHRRESRAATHPVNDLADVFQFGITTERGELGVDQFCKVTHTATSTNASAHQSG